MKDDVKLVRGKLEQEYKIEASKELGAGEQQANKNVNEGSLIDGVIAQDQLNQDGLYSAQSKEKDMITGDIDLDNRPVF